MEVRADKFLSGHYAYFAELPERGRKPVSNNEAAAGLELVAKDGKEAVKPTAALPAVAYQPERKYQQ